MKRPSFTTMAHQFWNRWLAEDNPTEERAIWRAQCMMEHAYDMGRRDERGRDREKDPYRGERGCTDCETMTHCESHHKDDSTYPE